MKGWHIHTIKKVGKNSVTLDNGISFCDICFSLPKEGQVLAIKYHATSLSLGSIEMVIVLEG